MVTPSGVRRQQTATHILKSPLNSYTIPALHTTVEMQIKWVQASTRMYCTNYFLQRNPSGLFPEFPRGSGEKLGGAGGVTTTVLDNKCHCIELQLWQVNNDVPLYVINYFQKY